MNRDIMLVCNSIMLLIILIVYTAIYYWGKKKKKAVWIELLGWTGIAVAVMVVFNTIYKMLARKPMVFRPWDEWCRVY
ncbi:MAG: hypothetical protein PUG60_06390 [Lachnospiraceae bacterium]|nr:hypothetical protein [Lachnospiraceae bacterium]MDY4971516.1 hypothetical protein [Lachnospiraceae bacterium]